MNYLLYILLCTCLRVCYGVSADINLNESIYIGRCRASCLYTFTHPASVRYDVCMKNEDCVMCWNSCRMLGLNSSVRSSICTDIKACYPGCQTACKFYSGSASQNLTPPVLDTPRSLPGVFLAPVAGEGDEIMWRPPDFTSDKNKKPKKSEIILYIIMVLIDKKWNEFRQTSSLSVAVPHSVRDPGIRLIAVTPSKGVIAFYEGPVMDKEVSTTMKSLASRTSPPAVHVEIGENSYTKADAHAIGEDIDVYAYEDDNNIQPPSVTVDYTWRVNLKPKSVDLLATVEVNWDERGSGNVDYMVSWTEAPGGLSGHLLSSKNTAEISVWPQQEYMIQVDLLDQLGNAVLRSVTEHLSFNPDKKLKRKVSTRPHKIPTTTTPKISTTTESLYSSNSKRLLDYFSPPQDLNLPIEKPVPQMETNPFNDWNIPTQPPWVRVNNPLYDNTRQSSEQYKPVLVWSVSLGVGVIIIVALIVFGVRKMRKKPFRRTEDSDTTVSSVNSSSFVMGSSRSSVEPWTYESLYVEAHAPHSSQYCPPQTSQSLVSHPMPTHSHITQTHPYQSTHSHSNSPHPHVHCHHHHAPFVRIAGMQSSPLGAQRINGTPVQQRIDNSALVQRIENSALVQPNDNNALFENYMLSVDHTQRH